MNIESHNAYMADPRRVVTRLLELRTREGVHACAMGTIDRCQVYAMERSGALPKLHVISRYLDALGLLIVDLFDDGLDSKLSNEEAADAERIGLFFKSLRERTGLNIKQTQLALAGQKGHTYERLERGENQPKLSTIARVCTHFGVTVESVFEPIEQEVRYALTAE